MIQNNLIQSDRLPIYFLHMGRPPSQNKVNAVFRLDDFSSAWAKLRDYYIWVKNAPFQKG